MLTNKPSNNSADRILGLLFDPKDGDIGSAETSALFYHIKLFCISESSISLI
jgi:hypothetical protein